MAEYLLGLATLPAVALVIYLLLLTFAPNATTDIRCDGCDWHLNSRIPIIQWSWRLAHRVLKEPRVDHVRRVREALVKFGYRKDLVISFEKRHRRAMNKIYQGGDQ